VPWDYPVLVALEKGVEPSLTSAAAEAWRQRYLRESATTPARKIAGIAMLAVGTWLPFLAAIFPYIAWKDRATIGWSEALILILVGLVGIALGLYLIPCAMRVSPLAGDRGLERGKSARFFPTASERSLGRAKSSETRNSDEPRTLS
jgi:hypothetical protein